MCSKTEYIRGSFIYIKLVLPKVQLNSLVCSSPSSVGKENWLKPRSWNKINYSFEKEISLRLISTFADRDIELKKTGWEGSMGSPRYFAAWDRRVDDAPLNHAKIHSNQSQLNYFGS